MDVFRASLVFSLFFLVLTCPPGQEWNDGKCETCLEDTFKFHPLNTSCLTREEALVEYTVYLERRLGRHFIRALTKLNERFLQAIDHAFSLVDPRSRMRENS